MLIHRNIMQLHPSNNRRLWKFVVVLTALLLQLFSASVYAAETKLSLNCNGDNHSLSSKSDMDNSISAKTPLKSIKPTPSCCDDGSNCSTITCHASGAIVNSDPTLIPGVYPSSSPYDFTGVSSLVKRNNFLFRPPITG